MLSNVGGSVKFKIADAKLHVPVAALSTKDNVYLTKQLRDGFKRSVYENNYQDSPAKVINNETNIHELRSASFQGIKRLSVLAFVIAQNAPNK